MCGFFANTFGENLMEEIEMKQEDTVWDELIQKSQLHRQKMRRKRRILVTLLIVAVLLIAGGVGFGFYMVNNYSRPLILPEIVQIQPLTVADQFPLQASDFVQGLEGTDIQVSFGKDYKAQQLGHQEISLVFTRGNEICTMTAQLYRFHIESSVTVAMGQESKLSIRALVPDETVYASFATTLTAGKGGIFTRAVGMVLGAFVFRLVYTIALRMNMPAYMLKLVSSTIVVIAIFLPYLKKQMPLMRRRMAGAGKGGN
jgi:flagellar basal body-associated protein FliL